MAIITPHVNTSIEAPGTAVSERDRALKAFLTGLSGQQDKSLLAQKGGQDQSLLDQKSQQESAQVLADQAAAQKQFGDLGGRAAVHVGSASLTPRDNSASIDRNDRLADRITKDVVADYSKVAGKSPNRVQAAQAILEALKSNDVTAIGRIKAQLPTLEGENYKPTDKERELILQTTGEGLTGKVRNFLGMSELPISDAQKEGLTNYVQSRLADEQGLLGRSKAETMGRWSGPLKRFSPEQRQALEASLGASSNTLVGDLGKKFPKAPPKKEQEDPLVKLLTPKEPAQTVPMSKEEWRAARKAGEL